MSSDQNAIIKPHWIELRHIVAREELVDLSGYANKTERFVDMAEAIKRVVERGDELKPFERDLIFGAYKKTLLAKRYSWQVLTEIIRQLEGCDKKAIAAIEYREQVEGEIRKYSNEVIINII